MGDLRKGNRLTKAERERVDQLDITLGTMFDQRAAAQRDKRHGFDQPWEILARELCLLTPQAYGLRLQNFFCEYFDWDPVKSSLDRGDAFDKGHVEIKSSVLSRSNRQVNLVQIRPYQDIKGYRVFVVDSTDGYVVHRFDLTKKQMTTELGLIGRNAHGTNISAAANSNREYSIRFPMEPGDTTYERWKQRYHRSTFIPERLDQRLAARDAAHQKSATSSRPAAESARTTIK